MKKLILLSILLVFLSGCGVEKEQIPIFKEKLEISCDGNGCKTKEKLETCFEVANQDFGWGMDYGIDTDDNGFYYMDKIKDTKMPDGKYNAIVCLYNSHKYVYCRCKQYELTIKNIPEQNPTPNTYIPAKIENKIEILKEEISFHIKSKKYEN